MDTEALYLIEEKLEPVCITLLALNQIKFVTPYLKIIGKIKNNPYYALHYLILSRVKAASSESIEEGFEYLEELKALPFSDEYNPKLYRDLLQYAIKSLNFEV